MTDSIDRLLAYQIESRHFPGALVHVERAGKVLAHQVAGRMRPDNDEPMHEATLCRLASLTKSIVTFAALMQVDEGALALDAPIADYLPEFASVRMSSGTACARRVSPGFRVRQSWLVTGNHERAFLRSARAALNPPVAS